jgi:virginiamycin B lyase
MNRALASLCLLSLALAAPRAHAIKVTEYQIPTSASFPGGLVAGPDGRLWFTESAKSQLGAVTTDGVFTEYPLANQPLGLAVVPGRLLAFGEAGGSALGFSTVDGFVNEYPGLSNPQAVVFGPDGRLWICDGSSKLIAFHLLASSPQTANLPLASSAMSITVGKDGRVWAAEFNAKKIAACSPETETCVEYPIASYPSQITAASDGSVWFTEGTHLVGRIDPHGVLTEFPTQTFGTPTGICEGPDGNMWFTEYDAGKIGRITTAGDVKEYALAVSSPFPHSIVLGPDGNLWFTERGTTVNRIAKLEIHVPGDVNDDGADDVSDVFYLINYLFAGGPAPR